MSEVWILKNSEGHILPVAEESKEKSLEHKKRCSDKFPGAFDDYEPTKFVEEKDES